MEQKESFKVEKQFRKNPKSFIHGGVTVRINCHSWKVDRDYDDVKDVDGFVFVTKHNQGKNFISANVIDITLRLEEAYSVTSEEEKSKRSLLSNALEEIETLREELKKLKYGLQLLVS